MSTLPLTKSNLKKLMSGDDTVSLVSSRRSRSQDSRRSRSHSRGKKKATFKRTNRNKSKSKIAQHAKGRKIVSDIGPAVKHLESVKKKMILAKEGFFGDTKDNKVDMKALQTEMDMMKKEIQLAKDAMRAMYGNRPFKIKIWNSYQRSSSAATALTAVETLELTSCPEFAQLLTLFDLGKCCGLTIHTCAQGAHATAAPELNWNCSYDPENSGVFISVVSSLASVYKTGVKKMSTSGVFVSTSPQPVDSSGMYVWHVPAMPPILPDQSAANTIYTGDWFDTANASIIVGYLKPYIPAATGVTTAITHYVEFHMEFKLRS